MRHWSTLVDGPVGPAARWVEFYARQARPGIPPHQVDGDGTTQEDLLQDMAVAIWMARARKPDAGLAYLKGVLSHKAADAQRRSWRARRAKAVAAQAPKGGWWSRDGMLDGEACLEATCDLSRLPQRAITRAAEAL